jgi:hypothetical protein
MGTCVFSKALAVVVVHVGIDAVDGAVDDAVDDAAAAVSVGSLL